LSTASRGECTVSPGTFAGRVGVLWYSCGARADQRARSGETHGRARPESHRADQEDSERSRKVLALAAVKDLELVARIRREKAGDMAETLGESGRREERVFAFAKVVVIEIDGEREHVDSQRVRERC